MENEQITTILEREGLSASQLADRLGVQRALISHLQNNRNRVSMEIVKKIHHAFPHISLTWLIDREGDYLAADASLSSTLSTKDSDRILSSSTLSTKDSDKNPSTTTNVGSRELAPKGMRDLFDPPEPVRTSEKSARKVVEIKVFYDDGTYETFTSASR